MFNPVRKNLGKTFNPAAWSINFGLGKAYSAFFRTGEQLPLARTIPSRWWSSNSSRVNGVNWIISAPAVSLRMG